MQLSLWEHRNAHSKREGWVLASLLDRTGVCCFQPLLLEDCIKLPRRLPRSAPPVPLLDISCIPAVDLFLSPNCHSSIRLDKHTKSCFLKRPKAIRTCDPKFKPHQYLQCCPSSQISLRGGCSCHPHYCCHLLSSSSCDASHAKACHMKCACPLSQLPVHHAVPSQLPLQQNRCTGYIEEQSEKRTCWKWLFQLHPFKANFNSCFDLHIDIQNSLSTGGKGCNFFHQPGA